MKFKKVEISAFRIFSDPKNGTFDFTIDNGQPANFVSLYAPNGFGKTSFYDAVEWCLTNNIQRFWQNEDITKESLSSLGEAMDEGKVRLLKNTNVDNSVIPYVKIETDDRPYERELRVHGNAKNDIQNKLVFERPGFRQVILSQEWISAFLKESDGESRYKIFMQNPALKELADYYKQVYALASATTGSIELAEAKIRDLQAKILKIDEGNLLETVNNAIIALQVNGEKISLVQLSSTTKDVLDLNDKVTSRITEITAEIDRDNTAITNSSFIKSGNERTSGLDSYFENLSKRDLSVADVEKSKGILIQFDEIKKLQTEINTKEGQRNAILREKDTIQSLLIQFEEYERINRLLLQKTDEKNRIRDIWNLSENDLSRLLQTEAELKARIESMNLSLSSIESDIVNLPVFKDDYRRVNRQITETNTEIVRLESSIANAVASIASSERVISQYSQIIISLANDDYAIAVLPEISHLENTLKGLLEKQNNLQETNRNINSTETKIKNQETFNAILQTFIQQGLEIVNNTQSSTCPLCTHSYDSYAELATKINSNNFLSSAAQDLFRELTNHQNMRTSLTTDIREAARLISLSCDEIIRKHQGIIEGIKITLQGLENELKENRLLNKACNEIYVELQRRLVGLTIDIYEQKLLTTAKDLNEEKTKIAQTLSEINVQINTHKEKISTSLLQIGLLDTELSSNSLNFDYLAILNWFKNNFPTGILSKEALQNKIFEIEKTIEDCQAKIAENNELVKSLENELVSHDETQLKERIKSLENERDSVIRAITSFESFFSRYFVLQLGNISKQMMLDFLKTEEEKHKSNIIRLNELVFEYQKLFEYNKNLLPFLQSENAKAEIAQQTHELHFLQETVLPFVEQERQNIQVFLEEKIKDFFYTDLINQIYNKIDPHPDFKGVEFFANFELENPRLDVFVTNSSDEQKLIPNLYFSTAQINILSLSIFLASALNSKEYDCIFIDDPIQSMDSINVLSTIDLLRGIMVRGNKQIILSTHDSNFHNLLRKKMPPELFKSKFMELETFGKVRL